MKIIKQSVELLRITEHAEKLIEKAARTCYQSFDKQTEDSYKRLIKHLIQLGHHSVLEHASATFKIITNRAISHEIVRHRIASYSQESTRYCAYKDNIEVIVPYDIEKIPDAFNLWKKEVKNIEKTYKELLLKGISPQHARDILPNCLATQLIMTANLREWRYFIKLRNSKQAHPQIRQIAKDILNILYEKCPVIFEDLI